MSKKKREAQERMDKELDAARERVAGLRRRIAQVSEVLANEDSGGATHG